MDDTSLISALVESYKRQLSLYRELAVLVQKTLSQVILTRGEVGGCKENFAQKQRILECIIKERSEAEPLVAQWQARKAAVRNDDGAMRLDSLLSKTQSAIREFLESEEQLKKYLEHVVKKGSVVS
jgi:hypothetical protein